MSRCAGYIAFALLVASPAAVAERPPETGERPEVGKKAPESVVRDAWAIQVLHRAARNDEGGLILGSRREALDEAVFALGEDEFLLEAWGSFLGGRRVACLVLPGAEALADAFEERASSAQPAPRALRRVSAVEDIEKGEIVVVMANAEWKDARATPHLAKLAQQVEERAAGAPRLFLIDLFESRVEGRSYEMDLLLAAECVEAAALLVEYVLSARASESIPPLDELFARHGVDRESVRWYRLALPYE